MNGEERLEQPDEVEEIDDVALETGDVVDGEVVTEAELAVPDELVLVAAQRDEYLEALQRVQAEFENFRKRMIRQQSEHLERASESLIERLLPALDALDLARAHSEASAGGGEPGGGDDAIGAIASLLGDVLTREGLERIDEAGVPFDPMIHDAVAHTEGEGSGGGHVVDEVLRAGYRLKGRVLRPAMVRVEG